MGVVQTSGGSTSSGALLLQGRVHGGQQPVSGASIQLYAVGSSGNDSAATPLIPAGSYALGGAPSCVASGTTTCYPNVLTNGGGSFSITGDYTCPSANAQVYIVSSGGNPGLSAGTTNSNLVMMAALGSCGSLSSSSYIFIDEVTTAAAAWTLAPFATDATHIGASATNATGIANAFQNAQLLADTTTGMAATLPANLTIETGKLYSLANALASCVNSSGGGNCSPLFSAATPTGGTAPADTFTAALNVVKNPGHNVGAVFNAIGAPRPYANDLAQAPNDWTMSMTVSGGGLNLPMALGVDAQGYVWAASQAGPLSEFTAQGTPVSTTGYGASISPDPLTQVQGLTIDSNNNIWIANYNSLYNGAGSVTEVLGSQSGSAGSFVTGTNGTPTFFDSSISYPAAISSNASGEIFIANNGSSSATIYNTSGQLVMGSVGSSSNLYATPLGIAADASGGFWLSDDDNTIAHFNAAGTLLSHVTCCQESYGMATDANGNVWVASYLSNSLSEVSSAGVLSVNQQTGGGLFRPAQLALDAAQNVWATNLHGNTISELAGSNATTPGAPLSPSYGYGLDAALSTPYSIVPDAAGNVWVSNQGKNALTVFLGLTTPTATPIRPVPVAP
jgi:streptogramin lyase